MGDPVQSIDRRNGWAGSGVSICAGADACGPPEVVMSARLVPLARLAPLFRFVLALAIVAAVSVGVVRPLLSWAAPASTPEPAPSTGATADLAAILPRAADFEAAGLPSFRSAGGRWLDHGARRDQPAGSEWRAGPATTAFLAAYELAWASAGTNPPRESTTIRTSATQFADDASAGSALNLLAPDGAPREIAGADEALLSNGPSGTAAATTLTVRMGATLLAGRGRPGAGQPAAGRRSARRRCPRPAHDQPPGRHGRPHHRPAWRPGPHGWRGPTRPPFGTAT